MFSRTTSFAGHHFRIFSLSVKAHRPYYGEPIESLSVGPISVNVLPLSNMIFRVQCMWWRLTSR